ncbi:tRNA (adenosine(37)-N6)-threonylcarbamoyltransferase complex dimerization subunit type 1 TsaB [Enterococcus massiliensis]|uniref:tRNA (adenosine(37)-N6)-threonylcarbamoyltransferase complex dimerization subunit type 1 TsaB n=1 Tax=Enterococcus massiliensis TaxID=1640685 RepID=UPI00065E9464|nr:tRNA (adenosine(37)-N6)-threonylcarbamoyltransferase complex dimerization subunit type 1 TsaB [Enterococcus massiliensis]
MKILAIDTSNQSLAIGLMEEDQVVGQLQTTVNKNHSVTLMPAIAGLVKMVHWKPKEITRIVVAQGPGSYTGLRIGVTTGKTLADTLSAELVGVSSLAVIAANCRNIDGWILPIFDARRGNVYAGAYQWQKEQLINVWPDQHISFEELSEKVREQKVFFVGADVSKFTEQIQQNLPDATINQIPEWNYPSGVVLAELGAKKPVTAVDTFLPNYLKRVEAEEKWLASHEPGDEAYVEKI